MNTPNQNPKIEGWAQAYPLPKLPTFANLERVCEPIADPYLVPAEILEAAIMVDTWFKKRGIEKWKLLGIQSREPYTSKELEDWKQTAYECRHAQEKLDALRASVLDDLRKERE